MKKKNEGNERSMKEHNPVCTIQGPSNNQTIPGKDLFSYPAQDAHHEVGLEPPNQPFRQGV
jgi:hypothetical protein